MAYKIRVVFDSDKEDVFRTIMVDEYLPLQHLHETIVKAFDFDGTQMASFYEADNNWEQGTEIPLFSMDESDNNNMQNKTITEALPVLESKLLYVYDFLNMWTFFIELVDDIDFDETVPKVILSVGNMPEEAPNKQFKSEQIEEKDPYDLSFEDEGEDDDLWHQGDMENIDDLNI